MQNFGRAAMILSAVLLTLTTSIPALAAGLTPAVPAADIQKLQKEAHNLEIAEAGRGASADPEVITAISGWARTQELLRDNVAEYNPALAKNEAERATVALIERRDEILTNVGVTVTAVTKAVTAAKATSVDVPATDKNDIAVALKSMSTALAAILVRAQKNKTALDTQSTKDDAFIAPPNARTQLVADVKANDQRLKTFLKMHTLEITLCQDDLQSIGALLPMVSP